VNQCVLPQAFGTQALELFAKTRQIQIAGVWHQLSCRTRCAVLAESIAQIPCQVEVASEWR